MPAAQLAAFDVQGLEAGTWRGLLQVWGGCCQRLLQCERQRAAAAALQTKWWGQVVVSGGDVAATEMAWCGRAGQDVARA